jgi:hypothetical protein
MIKAKFTKKAINSMSSAVLAVGYCELQNLLAYENEFGYSAGVYGWNCNYYYTPYSSAVISTGYRPTGQHIDHTIVTKYDNLAKIVRAKDIPCDEKIAELKNLISDFVNEVLTK